MDLRLSALGGGRTIEDSGLTGLGVRFERNDTNTEGVHIGKWEHKLESAKKKRVSN